MKLNESEIRTLPLPSPQQHRQFVAYLKDPHSCYKHLSLLDGGIFIVFLNPQAGTGHPIQHPSLPYDNTVAGYRQAFGYLDYLYSTDDDVNKLTLELPSDLLTQCSFKLYPYVSSEFDWSVHEADIASIQAGTFHPERSHLLAWYAAAQTLASAETNEEVSKQIRHRIQEYNLSASLQIQEVIRIEYYLKKLYKWHSQEESKTLIDVLQNAHLPTDALTSVAKKYDQKLPI